MPQFEVSKSIVVKAPVEQVYSSVLDFNNWQVWSPWLILEPGVKVNVQPGAKEYSWEGNRVGSGEMKVIAESVNKKIDYDLHFLKPWKSQADVSFIFEDQNGDTKVTWTLKSKLPFFMFFMKKQMTVYIGMDYQRGLLLLKDFIENGKLSSSEKYKGESQMEGFTYIGLSNTTDFANLPGKMSKDFEKLFSYLHNKDFVKGSPYAQYTKLDMVNDNMAYIAGVPVSSVPNDLPSDFVQGTIPTTKIATVEHKGPYEFLGNAWGMISTIIRNKEVKVNKAVSPFEIYKNDPRSVDKSELLTEIVYAIK